MYTNLLFYWSDEFQIAFSELSIIREIIPRVNF